MKDYEIFYPKDIQKEVLRQMPLIDMYITDGKLWVITKSGDEKFQPQLNRSIVHFRNGSCEKYLSGKEKLVKHDNIFYDFRNNLLVIAPKWMGKPEYSHRVDRFVGKKPTTNNKIIDYVNHNTKINYDKRFYDFERDRINLIIDETS